MGSKNGIRARTDYVRIVAGFGLYATCAKLTGTSFNDSDIRADLESSYRIALEIEEAYPALRFIGRPASRIFEGMVSKSTKQLFGRE